MRKDIKQMIDSNSDGLVTGEDKDLANKMQIGVLRVKEHSETQKKALNIIIGSQSIWEDNGFSEDQFSFWKMPKTNIGTSANSNKSHNQDFQEVLVYL